MYPKVRLINGRRFMILPHLLVMKCLAPLHDGLDFGLVVKLGMLCFITSDLMSLAE